jgi:Rad3-related DNA helicase
VGLKLEDKIIVFDEAHNIETTSESSCSFILSKTCLDFTMKVKLEDK